MSKRRRRKPPPRTTAQAAWRAYSMVRHLGAPTKKVMGALNEATTGQFAFGAKGGVMQFANTTAAEGIDQVIKERWTGLIAAGTNENQRIGDTIFMNWLMLDLMFISVAVVPPFVLETYPFQQNQSDIRSFIRILLLYEDDSITDDAGWQVAPGLNDIFQGCTATVGTATMTGTPEDMYKVVHGTYKSKKLQATFGADATDQRAWRQRNFTILYDKRFPIHWNTRDLGALPSDYAGTADTAEVLHAKKRSVNLRIPINKHTVYLNSASEAIPVVKGNLHLYVYSSDGNTTGANWPVTTVTPPSLNTCVRLRSCLYFKDV